MTITDPVITDAPAEGATPMYDPVHLRRRIDNLLAADPERGATLGELWAINQIPPLQGLLTAEQYRRAESLVNGQEHTAAPIEAHHLLWLRLGDIPQPIAERAVEALSVYAGHAPGTSVPLLTSVGRLAEYERIITDAVAYAEAMANDVTTPSVADLPPVDDTADQIASADYPGPKADMPTVLAWVGEDKNRAARAYALEQDRSTVRKGVMTKLRLILGIEGVAKINEALAAAAPPPLDLSAGPPAVPAAPADEKGAAGPEPVTSEASVGTPGPTSEAEPAAPTIAASVLDFAWPVTRPPTTAMAMEERVANALDLIGAGFVALASAVREVS